MKGKSLTQGMPWKQILLFAAPVFLGLLLQQLYNTVDTIIVGNYAGETALSAVGTTTCLVTFFLALANGFSAGAGVVAAQLFGAGQEEELKQHSRNAIFLMLGMGVLSMIIGFLFCGTILEFVLAVPVSLYDMAVIYFRIYATGFIFQFGYNIVAAILRAIGDSKATLYFLLISSVVNVMLDFLFVAIIPWGVAGAALATTISQCVSCFCAFIYMWKRYPVLRVHRNELQFDWNIARRTLHEGFPMALQQVVVSLGSSFIQRAVNGYGEAMIASFTVGIRMENYLIMPSVAFQTTMATYAGQNIGAGKMERIRKGIHQTIAMSEIISICVAVVIFLFAKPIVTMFGVGAEAAVYCTTHLRVLSAMLFVFASYFPILGLFQGAGNGIAATFVATTVLAARIFMTYTLCHISWIDYRIIWWGLGSSWCFGCLVTWTHYLSGRWKRKIRITSRESEE